MLCLFGDWGAQRRCMFQQKQHRSTETAASFLVASESLIGQTRNTSTCTCRNGRQVAEGDIPSLALRMAK